MSYLFDVSALMAWHHTNHPFHGRMHAWRHRNMAAQLSSCALGDLGFLRVSMSSYNYTLHTAQMALASVKRDVTGYIDTLPPPRLARWVLSHKQTTDAYFCQLAVAHGMQIATFEGCIKDPAAFLIS